jgi:hypothetical protein
MLTKIQQDTLDLYLQYGSYRKVAEKLGKGRTTIRDCIQTLEKRGLVPWLASAAAPEHLKMVKTTVQLAADGTIEREWRRLEPQAQQLSDIVDGLCDKARGKGKVPKRTERKTDTKDILFELDIFDAHVGMFADEKETLDENYDCDIAAKRMVEVAEGLARRAQRPGKCVLVFGGDMLHSDTRNNKTELSGHVLDVDTRYHRIVEYIIAASRDVVNIAASIAPEVEIIVLSGNHSWHSEVWLAQVLDAYYCNCPNVKVLLGRSPRRMMTFGNNLLVWAHGDKIPANKWAMIIAAEFAKEWGATKHRHLKMGHVHHKKSFAPVIVDEQSGLLVEYLEALAATDSWHANAGFVGSQKGASAFEYHREHGLMTRFFQPA